jgi:hypothetical protein
MLQCRATWLSNGRRMSHSCRQADSVWVGTAPYLFQGVCRQRAVLQAPPDYPPPGPRTYDEPPRGPPPGGNNNNKGGGPWRNRALLIGAFFLGLGAGVWFTEDVNLYPNNVASTELVDRRTPNSEVCMSNGYSAMVFDQRIFVSFNPCVPLLSSVNALSSGSYVPMSHAHCCPRRLALESVRVIV